MWCQTSPRKTLPLKRENLLAQMTSQSVEMPSEPRSRTSNFSAPRETARVMAGRARGQGWRPPQGQVCTAENALPEEKPSETPRPFHYKLLHFNPLLETMQTLIQKKKNTSAIRIFMSIQFPGFLIIAAIPRAGLAGTFLHRLAPPLPHPQSGCKGRGDGLSHAFFNFHT